MCCEKIALERTTVSLLQRKAYMLINGVIALFLRCFFYNSFLYTVFHQAILLYDYVSWFVEKEVADKEACGYCPFIRDRKKVFCCSDKRSITLLKITRHISLLKCATKMQVSTVQFESMET